MQSDDLVIADLAADVARLEAERFVYRELVAAALSELHDAQLREAGAASRIASLRDELRRYTAARVAPIEP